VPVEVAVLAVLVIVLVERSRLVMVPEKFSMWMPCVNGLVIVLF